MGARAPPLHICLYGMHRNINDFKMDRQKNKEGDSIVPLDE
jgi:hypothetical protein